jgi:hypothetical protein
LRGRPRGAGRARARAVRRVGITAANSSVARTSRSTCGQNATPPIAFQSRVHRLAPLCREPPCRRGSRRRPGGRNLCRIGDRGRIAGSEQRHVLRIDQPRQLVERRRETLVDPAERDRERRVRGLSGLRELGRPSVLMPVDHDQAVPALAVAIAAKAPSRTGQSPPTSSGSRSRARAASTASRVVLTSRTNARSFGNPDGPRSPLGGRARRPRRRVRRARRATPPTQPHAGRQSLSQSRQAAPSTYRARQPAPSQPRRLAADGLSDAAREDVASALLSGRERVPALRRGTRRSHETDHRSWRKRIAIAGGAAPSRVPGGW